MSANASITSGKRPTEHVSLAVLHTPEITKVAGDTEIDQGCVFDSVLHLAQSAKNDESTAIMDLLGELLKAGSQFWKRKVGAQNSVSI